MKKIEKLYNDLQEEALKEVERLVSQAFKEDKRLNDFVMAMGSVTFSAGEDILDDLDCQEYPAMKKVFRFFDEWDRILKLSGSGIWIKRDGTKLTKW